MKIADLETYLVSLPLRRKHTWAAIAEPFEYRDGCLVVPDKPGLGVDIDPAKLEKYCVGG